MSLLAKLTHKSLRKQKREYHSIFCFIINKIESSSHNNTLTPPTLIKMATPVIKLEPIRMGSLVSGSSAVAPGQKYLPPNMRTDTGPQKIDLTVDNFPSLGAVTKKAQPWTKPLSSPLASPAPVDSTLKDKIKEQIRQAELQEEERQKPREEDPLKMTRDELIADGWTILSLKSAHEARIRLNTRAVPAYVDSSEILLA